MIEFIVNKIKILNNIQKICVIEASYILGEEIYKDIVVMGYFKFVVDNKYKAKIIEENDNKIILDLFSIEQIEIDINVLKNTYKQIKEYLDIQDIEILLSLNNITKIEDKLNKYYFQDKGKIKEIIIKAYNENNLLKFLNNNGIHESEEIVKLALKKYNGVDIVKLFLDKPYYLSILGIEAEKVKDICKNNKDQYNNYIEILTYMKQYEALGNLFITKVQLLNGLFKKCNKKHLKLDDELIFLQNEKILTIKDNRIYLKDNFDIEQSVIDNINKRLNIKKERLTNEQMKIINNVINNSNTLLNNKQRKAVFEGITNNLLIITGGAGTGKTTIINGIIVAIKAINSKRTVEVISLAGKAANVINNRLNSYTNIRAKTIHRFLNIFDKLDKPIPIENLDYLIIDEVSMIDMTLFYKLLISIPIDTKIILVGDINQVSSIGLGEPLRDMLKSNAVNVVNLQTNLRQQENSTIAINAEKVLRQDYNLTYKKDEFEYFDVKSKNITTSVVDKVKSLINNGYSKDEVTILALTKGKTKIINEKVALIKTEQLRGHNKFIVNDKVIQNINDYNKNIYNGQVGKVYMIKVDNFDTQVIVDFEGNKITYKNKQVDELELAYSLTIHKMQGGQEKVIILVIDKRDLEYLNRNLIYTAITRATERFCVIGDMATFKQGIRKLPEEKNSTLMECLHRVSC
ncbi:AAA family ATPase [Clostridium paraputrificum]|uniref:ATP-dependent DNA helicase n=1 Tax=Clostridium paraputrificum TaxID=29363 RepID=UPI00232B6CE5|nr:AAA family ATPase [Clostridium paraputrificum]MDB2102635.1 AAA family ATPase [Clostridium paraputrificum]